MELNHLQYFYEVAQSGSFTAAARRLHISQSALSKAVALLEDREGVKLFQRSKKGVSLTAVGREVFLKSESIFKTVGEIELTCRGTQETCSGPLRFGASDHINNYLLLKNIHQIRAVHGEVMPSVFSGTPVEIVNLILANELEFGLFFTKVHSPSLKYEELSSIPMAVVCSPELARAGGNLRKLVDRFGLIASVRGQYQHHPSQSLLTVLGKSPKVAFESNSQEMQKRLCLEGGGVAYLARFMVDAELDAGTLVEIPLKPSTSLPLLLAMRRGRELSLSARTFLGLVMPK